MSDRRKIEVEVELPWIDFKEEIKVGLVKAISDLKTALNSIPAEFRPSATFRSATFRANAYGEYPSCSVAVIYEREETNEEIAEREADKSHSKAQREAQERRLYESLKAKYEP